MCLYLTCDCLLSVCLSYLQVFEIGDVRDAGDGVVRQVQVLQVKVLVQVLDPLDAVGGQAEPGEELQFLEALHGHDAVVRQVQDLEVTEFRNLEHPKKFVVLDRELKKWRRWRKRREDVIS